MDRGRHSTCIRDQGTWTGERSLNVGRVRSQYLDRGRHSTWDDLRIQEQARQASMVRNTEGLPAEHWEGSDIPEIRLLRELHGTVYRLTKR